MENVLRKKTAVSDSVGGVHYIKSASLSDPSPFHAFKNKLGTGKYLI